MERFILIIALAFGIFQILLLFKIWVACNDIKEINNKIPYNYGQNVFVTTPNENKTVQDSPVNNNVASSEDFIEKLTIGSLYRVSSSGILVRTNGYIKEEDSYSCNISSSDTEFVDSGVISKFKSNELISI